MKILKMTICFLLFYSNLFCQDYEVDNKVCIKIAPLPLLDIYSGMSPRMGVEYKLKNNFALYNEIGTYIPNVNEMRNNKGYLGKAEFKAYLNKDNFTSGPYLSAELFYKHQSYNTYDSIVIMSTKYSKDYHVVKDVTCFTLKIGALECKNRFVVDYFFGIGIRNRRIESSLTSEENNNIQQDGNSRINILKNQAGVFYVLNLDAGVKFGLRIK